MNVSPSDGADTRRRTGLPSWRGAILRARSGVRGKLMGIVLLTTAIAVLSAGIAMLTHDLSVYRQSWASDLATEAQILALSTAPALAFDDHAVAVRNLAALKARSQVLSAALYVSNGTLYAQYVRPGALNPPRLLQARAQKAHISGELVELYQPVIQNGEYLGSIFLRARYDVVGRIKAYLGIFALVTVMSLVIAIVLSTTLQKAITRPLEDMASVAREIVTRRDYSLRAHGRSDDEIGLVVRAFNTMLDEVQFRSHALEQSNVALQEEVKVRQAAQSALSFANARLESSMAAAEIGGWVWDLRSNELLADRNLASLYGLSHEQELSGPPALHRRWVHPDDLQSVVAAESAAILQGRLSSTEFRILRCDGSTRWVARRGKVQFDAEGKAILMAGLLIDITAQKQAEEALRQSEKLYRAIGESIDYGVWVCAEDGRNVYASDSFLRLTGMSQAQCSEFGWGEALHPEDAQATMSAWQECVKSGSFWYREHRVRGVDGRYHFILAQGVPIKDDLGSITGWAGINLDIARMKQTEAALRDADRRKDEFLATLAHELRNPLAPIRHAVKLLEVPTANEHQRQWGREVIARQVQRMALLLDDLLDVSRITRGRLDLKKDYVDLKALVGSAVETARPLIETKQHTLLVELPAEPIELEVDPLRLSQALSNLLTNAAKYTDAQGRIHLFVTLEANELVFRVQDTGIGLDPAVAPKLFEMFSQVESALDRAEGGLGIGLALVKGLVELHGGRVSVTSAGLGKGSEFTVRLPRSSVVERTSPDAESAAIAPHPVMGPLCKILLADDNRDAADSLALLLQLRGHSVCVAHTALGALELAADALPQVIILDIGMPDVSGYETARRIRQQAWGRHALLIAVTGWGQDDDKERARAAGFDEHFTKPVDPETIQQLILEFLSQPDAQNSAAGLGQENGGIDIVRPN